MPVRAQGLDWAAGFPRSDFAGADANARWIAFGSGERAGLSRHADLVGHHAAHDLVGAGRRQAGDARRICPEPRLCGARRSGFGRRNIGGCGPRSAPTLRSMPRASRSGSTIRATAAATLSIAPPARQTRSAPATVDRALAAACRRQDEPLAAVRPGAGLAIPQRLSAKDYFFFGSAFAAAWQPPRSRPCSCRCTRPLSLLPKLDSGIAARTLPVLIDRALRR